ncbi:MAG TPA: 23S rRNA (uracil(1939)-C(5))-methyltransferase RlmD [Gammaproteobacteria bacterium]
MRAEAAVEAAIVDLTHDGRGVADVDGRRLFVPLALPAERVLLAPRKRRRRYQEADLIRVVQPAPARSTPPCEYFGRCGGCALQHMAYDAQVAFKQSVVAQALERIGGVRPERWLPTGTGPELGYRRRARLGVKYVAAKERVLVGFRERAAPFVTDMARCLVLVPPMGDLIGELAELIGGSSVRDRVPQIEVAVGDDARALVFRALAEPSAADLERWRAFARRHDVDVYLQRGGPGTVAPLDPPARPLRYRLPRFDLTLEFAPTDFVQINAHVNAEMVATAVDLARVAPAERVLDLFCGLGNFSLPLAQRAATLLGVEGEAGLVARAAANAARNGIGNARFLTADLNETHLPFYRERWDVVLLDPPRTGAEAAVAALGDAGARAVVYVSCHPATLARDAQTLVHRHGYRLTAVRAFDMFPQTHHVEAVALFER